MTEFLAVDVAITVEVKSFKQILNVLVCNVFQMLVPHTLSELLETQGLRVVGVDLFERVLKRNNALDPF